MRAHKTDPHAFTLVPKIHAEIRGIARDKEKAADSKQLQQPSSENSGEVLQNPQPRRHKINRKLEE
jgi:hypothetical protein